MPSQKLMIGGGYSTSSERYFQGYIDNFSLYNRALSAAEVMTLYNNKGDCTPITCHSTCTTCNGESINNCLSCSGNLFLLDN